MATYIAYLNGNWIDPNEIRIDHRDRGFRTGDCVFDTARTFNGLIYNARRHAERFARSLKYARLDSGLTTEEWEALFHESVERNKHNLDEAGDFYIYPFVTRGMGWPAPASGPPTVACIAYPVYFGRWAEWFDEGVKGAIPKTRNLSSQQVDPKIKHQSRMHMNLAEMEAWDIDEGAYPVMLDMAGNITEGTINSVFLVSGGVLKCPTDSSILQSESRWTIRDLASQLGIEVVQEDLQPYDLYTADEAFLAFTGPCVLPLTTIDKRPVGDGKPGPITNQLLAAWSERVGVDIVGQAKSYGEMTNSGHPDAPQSDRS
ncbi:MAG: hypothetical protein CL880_03610 [Dehalococcoidia bacterium]|nr:hypothetical protein [Dehalococcoidia bacterium]|tara:strand:- start:2966 stop:3913 length:948 start_codon:yes stop_codon:yes gene_type:complete